MAQEWPAERVDNVARAGHRIEVRPPNVIVVLVVDRTEAFSPDDEVGGVDEAIAVEVSRDPEPVTDTTPVV